MERRTHTPPRVITALGLLKPIIAYQKWMIKMKKTIKQQIDDLANTIPEPYRTELLTKNPYPPNPEDCKMELCTEYSPACLLGICKKTVMQKGDW